MHPELFYKYMTSRTAKLVLQNGSLRWSSPTIFNDLAEFKRMPRFEPGLVQALKMYPSVILEIVKGVRKVDLSQLNDYTKDAIEFVKTRIEAGFPEDSFLSLLYQDQPDADDRMEQLLRQFVENLDVSVARVLCVTTDFNNEVMWANYAESHYGVVLGFRHIEKYSTPLLAAKKVTYSDGPVVVASGIDFLLYGDSPELRAKSMDAIFCSKKAAWQYENEWRAITWRANEDGRSSGDYKFYPEELESITFGARTSNQVISDALELIEANYPNTKIYKMVSNYDSLQRLPFDLEAKTSRIA